MSEPEQEKFSGAEIGKDVVQSTVEATASAVGEVATIITAAVRDVATAVGGLATELFEIRDQARRAAADRPRLCRARSDRLGSTGNRVHLSR